jgi:uncharacterized membrane protein YphA (DoxX/SURF4 family)
MPDHASISRRSSTGNIVLWIVQILLAAEFLYSAYLLLGDAHAKETFAAIGVGQWLRYVTLVLEAAGAIGLLIPRLCGLAALGLAAVMLGAAGTELFILDNGSPMLPLILCVASLVVAIFRRDTIFALLKRG